MNPVSRKEIDEDQGKKFGESRHPNSVRLVEKAVRKEPNEQIRERIAAEG
jgi:hypothetical protein